MGLRVPFWFMVDPKSNDTVFISNRRRDSERRSHVGTEAETTRDVATSQDSWSPRSWKRQEGPSFLGAGDGA